MNRFPLKTAAAAAAKIWAAIGGIVTGLTGVGIITADQNTAVQSLLVAVGVFVAAVSSVLAAFGVRRQAEPLVTPVADPRDDDGQKLTPAA